MHAMNSNPVLRKLCSFAMYRQRIILVTTDQRNTLRYPGSRKSTVFYLGAHPSNAHSTSRVCISELDYPI